MKTIIRFTMMMVAALLLIFSLTSCSKVQKVEIKPPVFYDEAVLTEVQEVSSLGYGLVENGNFDSAVTVFTQLGQLVPGSMVMEYNLACTHARAGDKEAALDMLEKLVAGGYDRPERLEGDPDFDSLHDDARFIKAVEQSTTNFVSASANFAQGMPEYDVAPDKFASEEELNEWASEEKRKLRQNGYLWTQAVYLNTLFDITARQVAALREMKANDPEFDYGYERIKQVVRHLDWSRPGWSGLSDMLEYETDQYLKSSPSEEKLGEVCYRAGTALSLKYSGDDPDRVKGYNEAQEYFDRVPKGTEYYGGTQAQMVANKAKGPSADEAAIIAELKNLVETFPGDYGIYRSLSTRLKHDATSYLWPIELGQADIGGEPVLLDQYKGKVLLIDFWASWCPPCRRELPNLVEIYNEYNPRGFEILSISLDYADRLSPEQHTEWIKENGMNWRHIYDGQDWSTPLVQKYFVRSIPSAYLVGPDGSLLAYGNECLGENLKANVEKALAGE